MLITWLATGRPTYVSQDGSIAYISDIGADVLKPLFITGGAITAVLFVLCLCIERLLRHKRRFVLWHPNPHFHILVPPHRLLPAMRKRERVFSVLAIIGSFIGGCGLILLTVFDTKRHPSLHRLFLLIFMIGVALSAIFTIVEVCNLNYISSIFLSNHAPVPLVEQELWRVQKVNNRLSRQGLYSNSPRSALRGLCCRTFPQPRYWR